MFGHLLTLLIILLNSHSLNFVWEWLRSWGSLSIWFKRWAMMHLILILICLIFHSNQLLPILSNTLPFWINLLHTLYISWDTWLLHRKICSLYDLVPLFYSTVLPNNCKIFVVLYSFSGICWKKFCCLVMNMNILLIALLI